MATVNYEVVYKLDGVESWLYFHSEEGKAKAAGEKKFKRSFVTVGGQSAPNLLESER